MTEIHRARGFQGVPTLLGFNLHRIGVSGRVFLVIRSQKDAVRTKDNFFGIDVLLAPVQRSEWLYFQSYLLKVSEK